MACFGQYCSHANVTGTCCRTVALVTLGYGSILLSLTSGESGLTHTCRRILRLHRPYVGDATFECFPNAYTLTHTKLRTNIPQHSRDAGSSVPGNQHPPSFLPKKLCLISAGVALSMYPEDWNSQCGGSRSWPQITPVERRAEISLKPFASSTPAL